MAGKFVFDINFDWSKATAETARFIQQVRSYLDGLARSGSLDPSRARSSIGQAIQGIVGSAGTAGVTPQVAGALNARLKASTEAELNAITQVVARREALSQSLLELNYVTKADIENRARLAAANKKIATETSTSINRLLAADDEYIKSTADLALARRQRLSKEQSELNTRLLAPGTAEAQLLNREAQNRVNAQRLQADAAIRQSRQISQAPGGVTAYVQQQGQAAALQAELNARIKAETTAREAASNAYVDALGRSAVAERTLAARVAQSTAIKAAASGLPEAEAAASIAKQALANRQRSIETQLLLQGDQVELKLQAERIVEERKLQVALNQRVREQFTLLEQQGLLGGQGTRFQQLQSNIASRSTGSPRLPTEFQTLGQFVSSKALTTAGFALSGAAFYGVFNGIRQVLDEGTKLQTNLTLIQEQLVQADRAGEFPTLRSGILDVARLTGVAGSDIAFLALQLRGAFQDESGARGGIQFVNQQLEQAGKIARVTGLALPEVTDSLTALSKTFGLTFGQIGDVTVGLQQRFGVLAKETIAFTADLAPVAKQAGLSFKDLAAIGAAVQRLSGRSGSSLAEALGRVLPTIQENASDIIRIYRSNSNLADHQAQVIQDLSQGRTGAVLKQLIVDYDRLDQSQKNLLVSALGGARQASTLDALFGSAQALRREFNRTGSDAGRLNQQFDKLGGTLSLTLAQLKQSAIQFGVALLNLGILDFLTDVGQAANVVFRIIQQLTGAITFLINALNFNGEFPWVSKLIELLLLLKGAQFLTGVIRGGGTGGGGLTSRIVPSGLLPVNALQKQQEAAASRSAVANIQQETSSGLVVVRQFGQEGAVEGAKVAERVGANVKSYVTNFSTNLRANLTQIGFAAAGVAANIIGEKVGGTTGSILGGAGTFATFAAFGAPEIGLVVGAGQILEGYLSAADQASKDAARLSSKYNHLATQPGGIKQLERIAYSGLPSQGGLDQFINGSANPFGSLGSEKIPAQNKAALDALQKASITTARNQLKAILSQLKPSDATAREIRTAIRQIDSESQVGQAEDYRGFTENLFTRIHQGLVAGIDLDKAIKDASDKKVRNTIKAEFKDSESGLSSLSAAKQLFESGAYSGAQYQQILANSVSDLTALVGANPANVTPQQAADYAQAVSLFNQYTSSQIKIRIDTLEKTRDITGKGIDDTSIQTLVEAASNPGLTDPTVVGQVLDDAYSSYRQIIQNRIDAIDRAANVEAARASASGDSAGAAAIKARAAADKLAAAQQGIKIDPAIRILQARQQIEQTINQASSVAGLQIAAVAQVLTTITGQQVNASAIYQQVATLVVNEGLTIHDALVKVLQQAVDEALAHLNDAYKLSTATRRLRRARRAAIAEAQDDYAKVVEALNTVLSASGLDTAPDIPDIVLPPIDDLLNANQEAQTSAIDAAKAARDAAKAVAQAQIDYLKALVENDPVAAAQVDQQAADVAAQFAETEADRISAAAQRIRADRSLAQAINDVINAQTEFAIAIAEASGDSVTSAQLTLQEAINKLNQAQALGAGQAEILRLQSDVVRQQASLRDAQLQEQEATIDFNLQAHRISQSQAIAQYQALLDSADILHLTEQEKRDLILKIQQLRADLGRDLQFNLPTELQLPTLYDVRRLNQSGGNFQDSRIINVNLTATNAVDGEAAVQTIVDVLTAPPRFGSRPRSY